MLKLFGGTMSTRYFHSKEDSARSHDDSKSRAEREEGSEEMNDFIVHRTFDNEYKTSFHSKR